MTILDFICEWLAEILDGSDMCCEYLSDVDDTCYEHCDYTSATPECWKRYLTHKFNEEAAGLISHVGYDAAQLGYEK